MRLDRYLVDHGLTTSRHRAQVEIKHGRVRINGVVTTKPSQTVMPDDAVTCDAPYNPYVSKGGLKLEHALKAFDITLKGKTVLDIGASTGGFTECALNHGAKHVIAVDVGHDQLHPELRNDKRITALEGTNFLDLDDAMIGEADIITIDVSFTSAVPLITHAYRNYHGLMVWLLKPQFEHGKPPKNGVIKHRKDHKNAIVNALEALRIHRIYPRAIIPSPILGGSGNREFLVCLTTDSKESAINIDDAVLQAHTIKG